jgi:TolB-like protein
VSFFEELKRRNVVRVGIAYAVVAWVLAQVGEFAFENFGAPEWVLKSFVVVLLLGLPIALLLAWAFEITPEGIRLEAEVSREASITQATGRKLDRAIIVLLVLALGYFIWERQAATPSDSAVVAEEEAATDVDDEPERSIAVLPLLSMSSGEEQQYFSDGLTEEILNALARTPDLLVASRTSSFQYREPGGDIQTIARELGVAHVLEGSVRRDANRLRVTAQLIRAEDGFHLWSQTYDRDPQDVIAIQEEVAIAIAKALETAMDPEALAEMVSAGTSTVAAYNAYLEGLGRGARANTTGDVLRFKLAREDFERAVALDPEFVLAYWELAIYWRIQQETTNLFFGMDDMPREEMLARFDQAIEQAIEHEKDPVNRLKYTTLRDYQYLRPERALAQNTEFLTMRPNDIGALDLQLELLTDLGRVEEMVAEIDAVLRRDVVSVSLLSKAIWFSLITADAAYIASNARLAMERLGDSSFIMYQVHRALLWSGEIEEARSLKAQLELSDLPDDSRKFVALRQACAEKDIAEAERIDRYLRSEYADNPAIVWLSHKVMGRDEAAVAVLKGFDDAKQLDMLADFLSYAQFDARSYPQLVAWLQSMGVTARAAVPVPYRCSA